jgi:hypothetical protein
MCNAHTDSRNNVSAEMKSDLINRVHPIVEIVDLPSTVNLAENCFLYEAIIV